MSQFIRCPSCGFCFAPYVEFIELAKEAKFRETVFAADSPYKDYDPDKLSLEAKSMPNIKDIFDAVGINNRCCRARIVARVDFYRNYSGGYKVHSKANRGLIPTNAELVKIYNEKPDLIIASETKTSSKKGSAEGLTPTMEQLGGAEKSKSKQALTKGEFRTKYKQRLEEKIAESEVSTTDRVKRHKKSTEVFGPYITQIFASGKKPAPTHLPPEPLRTDEFSRILDLKKRKPYEKISNEYKPTLHWGQLKLFLSEVEFLTKVIQERKSGDQIRFVYVGAAPGDHISYLADMFPTIQFDLYDPNQFSIKETKQIKIHQQFFIDADADYWSKHKKEEGSYVYFCSDIRSEPATQENITRNMNMQLNWWKIIQPELSMFKFRLPWENGKTQYAKGDLYIQAYPGSTSTETRLICKKGAEIIEYDNRQYEEACFYHNKVNRIKEHSMCQGLVVDKCYDCTAFEYIIREYLKASGKPHDNKALGDFIHEVEQNISKKGNTVTTKTINNIDKQLDHLYRMQYQPCGNSNCEVCISGEKKVHHKTSVATLDNEIEYISSTTGTASDSN